MNSTLVNFAFDAVSLISLFLSFLGTCIGNNA